MSSRKNGQMLAINFAILWDPKSEYLLWSQGNRRWHHLGRIPWHEVNPAENEWFMALKIKNFNLNLIKFKKNVYFCFWGQFFLIE